MSTSKYLNGNGLSEAWTNTKNYIASQLLGKSDVGHTHSASDITSGLSTVATSGSYNDLSNKPTIPTVNNATLTIQKNGTTVKTFTANASSDVTCNITVPTNTNELTNGSGFITANYAVPRSGGAVFTNDYIGRANSTGRMVYCSGTDVNGGACLKLYGKDSSNMPGEAVIQVYDGTNSNNMRLKPDGTLKWGSKNVAMQEDVIPRSGGAVLKGNTFARDVNNDSLLFTGGTAYNLGAYFELYGKNHPTKSGQILLTCRKSDGGATQMILYPNGTATWNGQSIQTTSDQRLKQQINEIDDKLLDAWEDVEPVQFKYNDAVSEKGDKARLHTGYVVQQIDSACKSHGVDISEYGLFCHEEYPEETEEVEVEQADGTKTKERKVIREASEHYSLRYTETLVVECAYLRKCIKELRNEIEQLKSSK